MAEVCLKHFAEVQRIIENDLVGGRCLIEDLTGVFHRPAFGPCLMTVDLKMDHRSLGPALDHDGGIGIIGKTEILSALGNGRIHGGVDITDHHGVRMTLIDLQLSFHYRDIQCRGDLADTAAIGLRYRTAGIGGRHRIAVLRIKGHQQAC